MMNALDMISFYNDVLPFEQVLHLNAVYLSGYPIHLIVPPLTSDITPVTPPAPSRCQCVTVSFPSLCNSLLTACVPVVINGGAKKI